MRIFSKCVLFLCVFLYIFTFPTSIFAQTSSADANGDGRVDGIDFTIWLSHYNQSGNGASNGDFNGSGFVDGVDFSIWLANYGSSSVTPTHSATATPQPTAPPGGSAEGIWISKAEIDTLPTTGAAWTNLLSAANASAGTPNLSDQDETANVKTLAKALVYLRTGQASYRQEVRQLLGQVVGTDTGRTLAHGRKLAAYVVAADLIDLPSYDASFDSQTFKPWLRTALTKNNEEGDSIRSRHEEDPNNWGTAAGASRIAADLYLNDTADLNRAAEVFRGWLGDHAFYNGFGYEASTPWQCNPSEPYGVNPVGCSIQGHPMSGSLPEELRRSGGFSWPPPKQNYIHTALQGTIPTAVMLHRAGFDAFNWANQAVKRTLDWSYDQASFVPEGNDQWIAWPVDYYYCTNKFTEPIGATAAHFGKIMDWTDWTHAGSACQ
jgi:hypothetical protein